METDVDTPDPPDVAGSDDDDDDDGFVWEDCPRCAIDFKVPERWLEDKRRTGVTFYCPNGHSLNYTPRKIRDTEIEKAKTEALVAKSKAEQLEAKLADATGRKWPWQK